MTVRHFRLQTRIAIAAAAIMAAMASCSAWERQADLEPTSTERSGHGLQPPPRLEGSDTPAVVQLPKGSMPSTLPAQTGTLRWSSMNSQAQIAQVIDQARQSKDIDLQAAVATIRIKCGAKAGKSTIRIAMHDYTWMTLKQHQGVLDRIKYQGLGAILTKELLAKMLDLRSADDIIITNARYTNSKKGATAAYKAFIGSDVIVALVDDTDDLNAQALGREFVFDGLGDGNNAFLVRKWIEEGRGMHLHVPFVGVSCAVKYQATNAANAAYLLQGVIDATDTNRYPADMLD